MRFAMDYLAHFEPLKVQSATMPRAGFCALEIDEGWLSLGNVRLGDTLPSRHSPSGPGP